MESSGTNLTSSPDDFTARGSVTSIEGIVPEEFVPIKLRVMLPGGGVKGAFQLGVLTEILASKMFTIDAVYGTSIGALMAPLIANEDIATLKNVFDNIHNIEDVVNCWSVLGMPVTSSYMVALFSLFCLGGYQSIKLADTLEHVLTPEQLKIAEDKCHVVAYDILLNKERWFSGSELLVGVRCSSALWLAVPPVPYDGTFFSDGGVTEIYPVDYIVQHHNTDPTFDGLYLFVDCDKRGVSKPATSLPSNGLVLMNSLHTAATMSLAEFELNRLREMMGEKMFIIRPDENILNSALDIDQERMKQTYEAGRAKGKAFLASMNSNI